MKKIISIATIVLLIAWLLNIIIYNDADFKTQNTKTALNPSKKDYGYFLKRIRLDRSWMDHIKKEAKENNLSVDSVLSKTAYEWEIKEQEKTKSKTKDYIYYLKRIKKDKKWMGFIKKEAKESNLSIDSVLSKTAYEWEKKHK